MGLVNLKSRGCYDRYNDLIASIIPVANFTLVASFQIPGYYCKRRGPVVGHSPKGWRQPSLIMIYPAVIVPLLIALGLRLLPHLLISGGIGVDHWFWKTYIETYRQERQFPPVLPRYVFDEQQWYPPLFPLLMSHLPPVLFERYGHYVSIIIDLMRMALLLGATYWLTKGAVSAVFVAGLVYATSAILISYNMQLNHGCWRPCFWMGPFYYSCGFTCLMGHPGCCF